LFCRVHDAINNTLIQETYVTVAGSAAAAALLVFGASLFDFDARNFMSDMGRIVKNRRSLIITQR
jgi:hypothetical protein